MNGGTSADSWMLGSTLNPTSDMAKELANNLEEERKAHSAYNPSAQKSYLGVPFPSRRRVSVQRHMLSLFCSVLLFPRCVLIIFFHPLQRHPSNNSHTAGESSSSGGGKSLEELLERQWEKGSQFLMEQASHYDSKLKRKL